MRTYQIRYKQFPRARRSIHTVNIEAESRRAAMEKFLNIIELAKMVQSSFILDHILIVSIFEEVGLYGQN